MERQIIAAVALAALAGPAAAQSARQFDLVCEGVKQEEVNGPESPHSYGFRIDLDANRWCWDHCERTFPIADVGPERITFLTEAVDEPRRRTWRENAVSRVDGRHEMVTINTRPIPSYYRVAGTCAPRPFSGFPAAQF